MTEITTFDTWAIIELMGHTRTAGRVTEETHAGTVMLRVDVPLCRIGGGQKFATRYFGASAIYCVTPTSEDVARAVAAHNQPEPIYPYELPRLPAPTKAEPTFEQSVGRMIEEVTSELANDADDDDDETEERDQSVANGLNLGRAHEEDQ